MKNIKATLLFILTGLFSIITTINAQKYPGYTLYNSMNGTTTYLMDTNQTNYKTWTHSAGSTYSSYLEPGGTLVRSVNRSGNSLSGPAISGQIQKIDWNGNITWDFVYSTTNYCSHHDHHVMPNGNVFLIVYDRKTASEATAAGCSQSIEIWSEKIVEIQPTGTTTGTVVWEWKLWDHLVQNTDASKSNYKTSIVNNPQLMNINYNTKKDWVHMNGIDYNPILDQIIVSSHYLNEWWIIDHSTTTAEAAGNSGGNSGKGGDLLYRWGNPAAYGASGTAVLKVTHDAHWIPEGVMNTGRLVGFNNKGVSTSKSSVDQIIPPLNGYNYTINLGSAYEPATYTERHACNGYSSNMGNSEQFPNGNMLVCVSTSGLMYEINSSGTNLWSKTATGSIPQAHHYTDCYIKNAAPAIPVITENGGTLNAMPATTYQWYLNGQPIAGATNQSYTPVQDGIYLVRITDVNGCVYQYSKGYNYIVLTGIKNINSAVYFNVFPNPTTGIVNISDIYLSGKKFSINIIDALGRVIIQNKNIYQLDLSEFEKGIYYVSIKPENSNEINAKIVLTK